MNTFSRALLLTWALWIVVQPGIPGEQPAGSARQDVYEYKTPSKDGIGKVYMGREISFVLGHRGIQWLERPERVEEEHPDLLVELLALAPDEVIADIGAGSGYFTFRMQPEVPRGKVVAVDIQPEMLATVEQRIEHGRQLRSDRCHGNMGFVGDHEHEFRHGGAPEG